MLQSPLSKLKQLSLPVLATVGLCACGSSASTGQSTVIVKSAAVSQRTQATSASSLTTGAPAPAVSATTVAASAQATAKATTTSHATSTPAPPVSVTTAATARTAAAASTAAVRPTARKVQSPHLVTCLSEAGLKQVRALGAREYSADGRGGTVLVRGPYRNSGAAGSAAHALSGVRGGNYVVYAPHATNLTGLVETVASCLGPGTAGYTI